MREKRDSLFINSDSTIHTGRRFVHVILINKRKLSTRQSSRKSFCLSKKIHKKNVRKCVREKRKSHEWLITNVVNMEKARSWSFPLWEGTFFILENYLNKIFLVFAIHHSNPLIQKIFQSGKFYIFCWIFCFFFLLNCLVRQISWMTFDFRVIEIVWVI